VRFPPPGAAAEAALRAALGRARALVASAGGPPP